MISRENSISVVLPSYNEKETMPEAIRRIKSALGQNLLEIIVVDDDSPDRTWEFVEGLNDPRCRLVRRLDKRGLASALAEGTRLAKGEVVVWLDCDLGIPPENILALVGRLDTCEVAIGSRYVPGGEDTRPRFRAYLSYVFNGYAKLILGNHFSDWTSGFAAVKRQVLVQIPLSDKGFGDYFIDWVYRCFKRKITVVEVPYSYGLRKGGVSKTDGDWRRFLLLGMRYTLRVISVRFGS